MIKPTDPTKQSGKRETEENDQNDRTDKAMRELQETMLGIRPRKKEKEDKSQQELLTEAIEAKTKELQTEQERLHRESQRIANETEHLMERQQGQRERGDGKDIRVRWGKYSEKLEQHGKTRGGNGTGIRSGTENVRKEKRITWKERRNGIAKRKQEKDKKTSTKAPAGPQKRQTRKRYH